MLNFDAFAEQVATEGATQGNNVLVGRIGKGVTDIRWVVPVDADQNDLGQSYQDVFVGSGVVGKPSTKMVIYALVAAAPTAEGNKGFYPFGFDGNYEKVQFEELIAHADKFGRGRRVVALSLPSTLRDALMEAAQAVDDRVTVVNFETGEIVSVGAVYRLKREGEGQKNTSYSAVAVNRKADVAAVDALIGVGTKVVPPQEPLSAVAEKLRASTAEKLRASSGGETVKSQF